MQLPLLRMGRRSVFVQSRVSRARLTLVSAGAGVSDVHAEAVRDLHRCKHRLYTCLAENTHLASTAGVLVCGEQQWQHVTMKNRPSLLQMWSWKLVVGAGAANAMDKPRITSQHPTT